MDRTTATNGEYRAVSGSARDARSAHAWRWLQPLAAIALAGTLIACGDDDDAARRCTDAGALLECSCEQGVHGTQLCGADGGLSACSCGAAHGDAAVSRDGGHPKSDAGTRDGGGSGSPATGSDASSGQPSGDSDGGKEDGAVADAGMGSESATMPLPMTGDQLSVCSQPSDCDPGFGCYDVGPGQAFCTLECTADKDCKGIAGAVYSCSADGMCEVDCGGGPPGVDKCPEGLVCMQVSGPGPGGARNRCKYSASAGTNGNAYSACSVPEDCDDGLQCVGAFLTIPGYCTHACTDISECTEQPSTGAITPSCLATACVLSCADDPTGCPDGMVCVETPLFSQCAYQ
jgi:hypothetical protein